VAALTGDDDPDIGNPEARTYLSILGDARHRDEHAGDGCQSATSNSDANDAFSRFMQNYVLTAGVRVLGGGEQRGCGRCSPRATWWERRCCAISLKSRPGDIVGDEVVHLIAPTLDALFDSRRRRAWAADL